MRLSAAFTVVRLLVAGAWTQSYGRSALTVLVIALGVALGAAIHTINHSAATELSLAVRSLAGEADVSVRSSETGFDEALYPRLAARPEILAASPALELRAKVAGSQERLRVIGIDPLRALTLQPALLGDAAARVLDLLREDAVMLSTSAAQRLGAAEGDVLRVQVGVQTRPLRVIAILPVNDALRQPLALMDIAAAQWTFERLGLLTRIDLRLREGHDPQRALAQLNATLPPGVHAIEPELNDSASLALSRAYRVNLNMLALISLFTGAVLVFSTQVLSALKRRTHFALLRTLGMTRTRVIALLALEATAIGIAGSVLGIALGIGLARIALAYAGADLGAGFFQGIVAGTSIDPIGLSAIAAAGILASLAGGSLPAREAGRVAPAQALRAGSEQGEMQTKGGSAPGAALFLAAAGLLALPPVAGLPVFGYAAIGCFLLGAIALMPAYVRAALAAAPRVRFPALHLALAQIGGAPRYAAISLATILASFSLAVAMLIMIHSFRHSLDAWLQVVLPADLYARAGVGDSAWLDERTQERIGRTPGIRKAVYSRVQTLEIDPRRPPVTLIARDLDPERPEALPLIAPQRLPADGTVPVWISEAMRDLYGAQVGERFAIPLAGQALSVAVAGVWRDYVRQGGALLIGRADYVRLTGDRRANEAWLWLEPDRKPASVTQALREAIGAGGEIELREPGLIRAQSLAAFDRTFAVTYALQAAALAIALFGTGISISAQALARRAEFGMLYHIGMTRDGLARMLGCEGAALGALGAAAGTLTGILMSLVLIHVINRQSFHWSMDVHWPAAELALLSAALVASCAAAAAIGARHAIGTDAIRAVREDW